jgi:hypothetical protein
MFLRSARGDTTSNIKLLQQAPNHRLPTCRDVPAQRYLVFCKFIIIIINPYDGKPFMSSFNIYPEACCRKGCPPPPPPPRPFPLSYLIHGSHKDDVTVILLLGVPLCSLVTDIAPKGSDRIIILCYVLLKVNRVYDIFG